MRLTGRSLYGNLDAVDIIGWSKVQSFGRKHTDALPALQRWYDAASRAAWHSLVEVRREFAGADAVGPLTVFNIRGNRYRLVVRIDYRWQLVSIKSLVTHSEYDRGGWKE